MKCLGFQIFTKGTASQERQEAEAEETDSGNNVGNCVV